MARWAGQSGQLFSPACKATIPTEIVIDTDNFPTDRYVAEGIAAERGRADFPFLRNWDAYEAHTWANGIGAGVGEFGNNNESSSESINAWAGLILWGEVTGNKALRDLGIYLYTNEIESINHYWFETLGRCVMQVPKAACNDRSRSVSVHEGMRLVGTEEGHFVCGPVLKQIWELSRDEWHRRGGR